MLYWVQFESTSTSVHAHLTLFGMLAAKCRPTKNNKKIFFILEFNLELELGLKLE